MDNIEVVPPEKAYRLINHGPTTLISSRYNGQDNIMAAAWVCALDFNPPKLTVVIDKETKTREMVEKSGFFVAQIPTIKQLELTQYLGTHSKISEPKKLNNSGAEIFNMAGYDLPFVKNCSAWLACKVLPEENNQQKYDLFIGEIIDAWADSRAFKNGHWQFESGGESFRSIHHVAGGHFYAIGDAITVKK